MSAKPLITPMHRQRKFHVTVHFDGRVFERNVNAVTKREAEAKVLDVLGFFVKTTEH